MTRGGNSVPVLFFCAFQSLALFVAAQSDLTLNYHLQDQRPPVARVNQDWSFSLFPDTFTGSDDISYDATGLPSWATFDSDQLQFSGTPGDDDQTSSTVTLKASSSSGDSVSGDFVLLVSDADAPTVHSSIASQLPNASSLEPECVLKWDGALRIPPHEQFTMQFDLDTFADDDGSTIYYTCYTLDNTTLPDWLNFDNTTLSFKGTTPANGVFNFTLFGSDHYGYGDVQQHFMIRVDAHSFDLLQPLAALNATSGGPVNYTIPIEHLSIDHMNVTDQNITVPEVDLSAFPGLNFTEEDRHISGTMPDSLNTSSSDLSIPVTLKSSYSQYIQTKISVNIVKPLFSARDLPSLEVPYGKDFSKDLSDYLVDSDAEYSATFSPSSSSSWLKFDASKKMLTGTAPDQDSSSNLPKRADGNNTATVDFSAYNEDNGVEDDASMPITLNDGAKQVHDHPSGGLSHGAILAIAIVFGVLGGLALLALLVFCCCCCLKRRRQKKRAREAQQSPSSAGGISFDSQHSFTIVPLPFGKGKELKSEKGFEHDAVMVDRPAKKQGVLQQVQPQEQQQQQEQSPSSPQEHVQRSMPTEDSAPRRLTMLDPLGISGLGIHTSSPDANEATFQPQSTSSGNVQADASTWGSSKSSSLFYSDETHSNGHSSSNHSSGTNRSAPQQRSDFKPVGRTVKHSRRSSATSWISTGIRYISGTRQQDTPEISTSPAPSQGPPERRRVASSRLVPVREASIRTHSNESSPALTPSFVPASPMSMGSSPQLTSQPLLRVAEEFDDAPEPSPQQDRFSVASYEPDRSLEVAHSPIFFDAPLRLSQGTTGSSPAQDHPEWTPHLANGSTIQQVERQSRSLKRQSSLSSRHSAYTSASAQLEPGHIAVDVGAPFHFTPSLTPPPQLESPTRGGRRSTYTALLWSPDDPEQDGKLLPDWLHFADREIEFVSVSLKFFFFGVCLGCRVRSDLEHLQWGIPPQEEYGCTIGVQVIEHKHRNSPPMHDRQVSLPSTAAGGTVVCKLMIDLLDRRSSRIPEQDTFKTLAY